MDGGGGTQPLPPGWGIGGISKGNFGGGGGSLPIGGAVLRGFRRSAIMVTYSGEWP